MVFKLFSYPPILIFIFLQIIFSTSEDIPGQYLYENCANKFSCGSIARLGYPFSGQDVPTYCGYPGLDLKCKDNVTTTIEISNMKYRVFDINQSTKIMRIAREDTMESTCPQDLVNTTMESPLFQISSNYTTISFLYGCPSVNPPLDGSYSMPSTSINIDTVPSCEGSGLVGYIVGDQNPLGCNKSIIVPVSTDGSVNSKNWTLLEESIRQGFSVKLKVDENACIECIKSNGRCGYNVIHKSPACYCSSPPFVTDTTCSTVEAPKSSAVSPPGTLPILPFSLLSK